MSPSVQTIALLREVAGRKAFKKYIFEPSFKEAKDANDLNKKKDKYIRIPKGVTSIGDHAFYYCKSLKEIVIPTTGRLRLIVLLVLGIMLFNIVKI